MVNFEFPNTTIGTGSILDKTTSRKKLIFYMLNRTQSMFKYSGLPETMTERMLELYLQTNGHTCVARHESGIYAFYGGLGGEKDEYYQPTTYMVSNPYLSFSKEFTIGVDCVQIRNDSLRLGLLPMFEDYAELISENNITIRTADINIRNQALITAQDDKTMKSAELYLKRVEEGKTGVVLESAFLEGIKVNPTSNGNSSNYLTQLIELQQYLKASWMNEIGLQANYNMKRESINVHEAQMNNDGLIPLIDDMLNSRLEGIKQVNEMFDLNITVELGSSWKVRKEEVNSGQPENLKENEPVNDPIDDPEPKGGEPNE